MDLLESPDYTDHIETLMKRCHNPGVSIAIVHNQNTTSRGYGYAKLSPEKKPVSPDTLFDIASSSKSLTAAAIGLLVDDDGRFPQVQWESVVSKLLPEDFVMSGDGYTESVTVEDILSHRTGLPGHDDSYMSPRAARPDTPRSVTRNLRNLPVAAPIRSKFMYNNMMFTVATYLVEQLTGLTFEEFLQKHFFTPLGMTSTRLQPDTAIAIAAGLEDRLAVPHTWKEETGTYASVLFQQCPEAQGAGSIMTSADDYIKWVKALMNHEAPITASVYQGLTKPRTIENPDDEIGKLDPRTSTGMYAAGLSISYYRGYKVVCHYGAVPGFGSAHFFLPEVKFGGVVLGNSGEADVLVSVVARELIDEAIGVPRSERPDWEALERQKVSDVERKTEEENQERRKGFCAGTDGSPQPQRIPLRAYTGVYWNAGYHGMTVEIKDEKLFVDATDRSMGFTLTFEHLGDQTVFAAHLSDYYEGGDDELAAEFRFQNDRVVKMGLKLEENLDGLIWFDKVENTA